MSEAVDFDDLDCALYVDGAPDAATLAAWVLETLALQRGEHWLLGDGMALDAEDNDDARAGDRDDPQDGFLFYDHVVEVYFAPSVGHDRRVQTVATLMREFWSRGLRVTAATGYEDELPRPADA
jgi:hypothetical protein